MEIFICRFHSNNVFIPGDNVSGVGSVGVSVSRPHSQQSVLLSLVQVQCKFAIADCHLLCIDSLTPRCSQAGSLVLSPPGGWQRETRASSQPSTIL